MPDCYCAGQSGPIPVEEIPQFILFTHDDITGEESTSLMNEAREGIINPNGCRAPATFFTMGAYTDCDYVRKAFDEGDEIACHTVSHEAMGMDYKGIEAEIAGQREWLINQCGMSPDDVVGHRSPYLVNNPQHRQALAKGGFLYDSTISEHWPNQGLFNSEPRTTSPDGGSRLWPYTMDYGVAQNCRWTGNLCKEDEVYEGLWEVPVWVIQNDNYPENAFALDPCDGKKPKECDPVELLKFNFLKSYNGNKAPVPVFVHSFWLVEKRSMSAVKTFFKWITDNYPDAYFVTMHQLIQWMKNPVPKSKMGDWLGCVPGGKAAKANIPASEIEAPVVPPTIAPTLPDANVPTLPDSNVPNLPVETVPPTPDLIITEAIEPTVDQAIEQVESAADTGDAVSPVMGASSEEANPVPVSSEIDAQTISGANETLPNPPSAESTAQSPAAAQANFNLASLIFIAALLFATL